MALSNMSYHAMGHNGWGGTRFTLTDNTPTPTNQIQITKQEKRIIKRIFIAVISITAMLSLLLGMRGVEIGFSCIVYFILMVLMPYFLIIKPIFEGMNKSKAEKLAKAEKEKHPQLELPL